MLVCVAVIDARLSLSPYMLKLYGRPPALKSHSALVQSIFGDRECAPEETCVVGNRIVSPRAAFSTRSRVMAYSDDAHVGTRFCGRLFDQREEHRRENEGPNVTEENRRSVERRLVVR